MKALILNSGLGSRMGDLTATHPKCMTVVCDGETILERQIRLLARCGISDIVMTTGAFRDLVEGQGFPGKPRITHVFNDIYSETNYIYSMYLARELLRGEEIVLLHGDLVFDETALKMLLIMENTVTVSGTKPLPDKDFKAETRNNRVYRINVDVTKDPITAMPMYHLNSDFMDIWLTKIEQYCENGNVKCYAESALNDILSRAVLSACDIGENFCMEVDTPEDLAVVREHFGEGSSIQK